MLLKFLTFTRSDGCIQGRGQKASVPSIIKTSTKIPPQESLMNHPNRAQKHHRNSTSRNHPNPNCAQKHHRNSTSRKFKEPSKSKLCLSSLHLVKDFANDRTMISSNIANHSAVLPEIKLLTWISLSDLTNVSQSCTMARSKIKNSPHGWLNL